jgi:hypothetical protein
VGRSTAFASASALATGRGSLQQPQAGVTATPSTLSVYVTVLCRTVLWFQLFIIGKLEDLGWYQHRSS